MSDMSGFKYTECRECGTDIHDRCSDIVDEGFCSLACQTLFKRHEAERRERLSTAQVWEVRP